MQGRRPAQRPLARHSGSAEISAAQTGLGTSLWNYVQDLLRSPLEGRAPSRPCFCGHDRAWPSISSGHEGPWPSTGFSHGGTRSVASVFLRP